MQRALVAASFALAIAWPDLSAGEESAAPRGSPDSGHSAHFGAGIGGGALRPIWPWIEVFFVAQLPVARSATGGESWLFLRAEPGFFTGDMSMTQNGVPESFGGPPGSGDQWEERVRITGGILRALFEFKVPEGPIGLRLGYQAGYAVTSLDSDPCGAYQAGAAVYGPFVGPAVHIGRFDLAVEAGALWHLGLHCHQGFNYDVQTDWVVVEHFEQEPGVFVRIAYVGF